MGARNSKRSMDVTTTPKKEGLTAESGDTPAIGDGKLERIEEIDAKPTTNGVAPHIDTPEEKDIKDKDSATEKERDKNGEETKAVEETNVDTQAESPTEGGESVTTPTEETTANTTSVSSPETKESKKKPKKKWSFRSISFSKKDKNKPVREETPKNGDVSKDEPLIEGGEDVETAAGAAAAAPAEAGVNGIEEKTSSTSPTTESSSPVVDEVKEEEKTAPSPSSEVTVEASSVDDKTEVAAEAAATPSSPTAANVTIAVTPVPAETNNDEVEKYVEKKIVEVSPVQAVAVPVEVTTHTQPIVTPSIIERKTSEDFHSLFPSSPPPTPIDPSPLQKAQQAAANADALAEALKFPVEIKQSRDNSIVADEKNINSIENATENIENHLTDEKLNIPNVSEFSEIIVEKEEQVLSPVDVDILQSDLVVQTEEGPIPVSNCEEFEMNIDSTNNIISDVNEKIVEQTLEVMDEIISDANEIIIEAEKIPVDEELQCNDNEVTDKIDTGKILEDIPPPLPESPVPMPPKSKTDLLNFMTSQIEDSPITPTDLINITKLSTETVDVAPISDTAAVVELQSDETLTSNHFSQTKFEEELCGIPKLLNITPLSEDVDDSSLIPPQKVAAEYEILQDSVVMSSPESSSMDNLTSAKSSSPTDKLNDVISECPLTNGHDNETAAVAKEVPQEIIEQTNSELDCQDRYARTNEKEEENAAIIDSPLTRHIENDEQSIAEPEAQIEKHPVSNDISTEIIEEAPKNLITEAPSSKGPMITEDVASVTKAVEEIDINEKAVAAAVNENVECITKKEIVAEMNHQNNLSE